MWTSDARVTFFLNSRPNENQSWPLKTGFFFQQKGPEFANIKSLMSLTKADFHMNGSVIRRRKFNVKKWCICFHLMSCEDMFEMAYGLLRKQRAETGMSLDTTSYTTFSVKLDGGLELKLAWAARWCSPSGLCRPFALFMYTFGSLVQTMQWINDQKICKLQFQFYISYWRFRKTTFFESRLWIRMCFCAVSLYHIFKK